MTAITVGPVEDVWQPTDVIDELAKEMKRDPRVWELVVDRLREGQEIEKNREKNWKKIRPRAGIICG